MTMTMTTGDTIRIHLQAGDPISRAGISAELAQGGAMEVVEDPGLASVALVVAEQVDEDVQCTVRRLRRAGVEAVVLVVATIDDQGLFGAVEAGVTALMRRSEATSRRLEAAIVDAHDGNGSLPNDLLGRLMKQVNQLQDHVLTPQGLHLNGLKDREVEVLRLVAKGHTTTEIAQSLSYSERTIKNVIQDVTTRLNLRNRSHAVAWAMRHGLI